MNERYLISEKDDVMAKQDIIKQITDIIIDNKLSINGAEEIFMNAMRYIKGLKISS